jgi:vacuolar-type H+-ATPase subunit F/Vma7
MTTAVSDEEPLAGFQIVGYDEVTKVVTIELDRSLILTLAQQEDVINKLIGCSRRGPIKIVTRTPVDERREMIAAALNQGIWDR